MEEDNNHIKVVCRIRPANARELNGGLRQSVHAKEANILANMKPEKPPTTKLGVGLRNIRKRFADGMKDFSLNSYTPFLEKALDWRALTLGGFFLAFVLSITLVSAGYIKQRFMPDVPSDFISMRIEMPDGYSLDGKVEIAKRAERAAAILQDDPEIQSKKC